MRVNELTTPRKQQAPTCAAYHKAKADLELMTVAISRTFPSVRNLREFIRAAWRLHKVTVQESALNNQLPLDLLFWFRDKLKKELKQPYRKTEYLACCRDELNDVEACIQQRCVVYGKAKVIPLLC